MGWTTVDKVRANSKMCGSSTEIHQGIYTNSMARAEYCKIQTGYFPDSAPTDRHVLQGHSKAARPENTSFVDCYRCLPPSSRLRFKDSREATGRIPSSTGGKPIKVQWWN